MRFINGGFKKGQQITNGEGTVEILREPNEYSQWCYRFVRWISFGKLFQPNPYHIVKIVKL